MRKWQPCMCKALGPTHKFMAQSRFALKLSTLFCVHPMSCKPTDLRAMAVAHCLLRPQ